jgi:uracil-DNA glycosylase
VIFIMTTQEKQIELNKIAAEIKAFKGLDIAKAATHAVPGEGNPDTTIMFIGEAPGFNEDQQGRPFVGQAGKLLEKTLKETLNMDRSQVYITNIVKFRPPDNRDPFPNEIEACAGWLDRQINIIQPKIIATLGRFSMAKYIPDVTISRVHGVSRYVNLVIDNCDLRFIIFPMYHPAAALRAGSMMQEFVSDFGKLRVLLQPTLPREVLNPSKDEVGQTSLF